MAVGGAAKSRGYKIVYRPVSELIPYANNARTHSDEQIAKIMASLIEFGWTNPVLLADGSNIVAGHGRAVAAHRIYEQGGVIKLPNGYPLPKGMVPTIDCTGWSAAQRKAYVIADNALAAEAGWDGTLLKIEIDGLNDMGFDIDLLGFSADNLAAAIGKIGGDESDLKEGFTDPDEVPPPPQDPVTVPGDVWLLGPHRLVCGDSTEEHTVAKCLNGVTPMLMDTDPPYGVDYDADWRTTAKNGDGSLLSTGDDRATGAVLNDEREHWRDAWALFPGDVAYVWASDRKGHHVALDLEQCGFEIRAQIIWRKNQFVVSRGHYHPQHEPCIYAVRKGGKGHWSGDRKQSTVWDIDKPHKSETGHSTQKPVECMRRPMENNSSPGQAIYDPFVGSGTSIIAAEQIGRVCHAIELNPRYCDVAITRWQEFTHQTATLEATGQTFVEMMAERVPNAVITSKKKANKKGA